MRNMFRITEMRRLFFSTLTVIVLMNAVVFAQNGDSYIKLTRISLIEGNPGYQRVPEEEWNAASINMPLEPGDRIYTGRGGRVEIEFEEGSVLRLAENTDIEFLTMDEDFVQIRMLLGIASLKAERDVDFEIASPAAAFSIEKNGIYRFEAAEDGSSNAVVRKGRLEAANNYFMREIKDGVSMRAFPGDAEPVITAYTRRDAWDEWTDRRDADRRPASGVKRYIPDNVSIGVTDLERQGRWVHVTNYGWGWRPYSVAGDWSPYSVGRWVYRPRFGWTWVSYESWGWLPYHYGRWHMDIRVGWVWLPGNGVTFRFWSPGLVAFYRGPGWVSWGPLGPGDYYDSSRYRYRGIYAGDLARLSAFAVRKPGNYINRNVRGAFRTLSIDRFRGAGGRANTRLNDFNQQWAQGTPIKGDLDVSPVRESFRPAPDRHGERSIVKSTRPVVVRRMLPQTGANEGRFSAVKNPRVSPLPDSRGERRTVEPNAPESGRPGTRFNAERGNNNGSESPAVRRSNETRPDSSGFTRESSPGNQGRQAAPDGRNNSDSSLRNPTKKNRDRIVLSEPPAETENRQSLRPNSGNSSSARESTKPGVRKNSRPSAGENSSSGRGSVKQRAPK